MSSVAPYDKHSLLKNAKYEGRSTILFYVFHSSEIIGTILLFKDGVRIIHLPNVLCTKNSGIFACIEATEVK